MGHGAARARNSPSRKQFKNAVLDALRARGWEPVYGAYIDERAPRNGEWVTICSPLREDRRPSFGINMESGRWHDLATEESGDVFEFLKRAQNLEFSDALDHLISLLGVTEEDAARAPEVVQSTVGGGARGARPPGRGAGRRASGREKQKGAADSSEGDPLAPPPTAPVLSITAIYRYTDRWGAHLYDKIRLDGKDEDGAPTKRFKWKNVADPSVRGRGGPPLLYRLHQLTALRRGTGVFLVEGEKCVSALAALRLPATCGPDGAKSWTRMHVDDRREPFRGLHVVILPDNDDPGRRHARTVAGDLAAVAASITIVDLPNLPPGGDVADWIPAHPQGVAAARESLFGLVADAPPLAPADLAVLAEEAERAAARAGGGGGGGPGDGDGGGGGASPDGGDPLARVSSLNDIRLARSFRAHLADDWLYLDGHDDWLHFNGVFWEGRAQGGPSIAVPYEEWAAAELVRVHAEIDAGPGARSTKQRAKNAADDTIGSLPKMRRILDLLKIHLGRAPDDFDRNAHLLPAPNAIIDLRSGAATNPERAHLARLSTEVPWDPAAHAPRWHRFIDEISCGRPDLAAYLQRAAGYLATGETRGRAFFVFYGTGRNGKSVFVNTIREILGPLAKRVDQQTFLAQPFGRSGPQPDLARLAGARLAYLAEIPDGARLDEARVKEITGGEPLVARFLHQHEFEFTPRFKLVITTNNKPEIREGGTAIWERMHAIPFDASFPAGSPQDDPALVDTLAAERPGILAWIVAGAASWYAQGLAPPPCVLEAVEEYRQEQDPVGEWMGEMCATTSAVRRNRLDPYCTPLTRLWSSFSDWCKRQKISTCSKTTFGMHLQGQGFIRWKTHGRVYWLGVRLLEEYELGETGYGGRGGDGGDEEQEYGASGTSRAPTLRLGGDTKVSPDEGVTRKVSPDSSLDSVFGYE